MSLKIQTIDANRVDGILDGSLTIRCERTPRGIRTKIASWHQDHVTCDSPGKSAMRLAAYAAIARYRQDTRAQTGA